MPNWLRIALALLVGIVCAGLIVGGVEVLGHGVVSGSGIFMVAAAGLGVSALIGGSIAIWIGKRAVLAWVVAAVLACLSLINVFSFPHPVWFVPVGAVLLILGAFVATHIFRNSKGAA